MSVPEDHEDDSPGWRGAARDVVVLACAVGLGFLLALALVVGLFLSQGGPS